MYKDIDELIAHVRHTMIIEDCKRIPTRHALEIGWNSRDAEIDLLKRQLYNTTIQLIDTKKELNNK
jgi:hypothetical protein